MMIEYLKVSFLMMRAKPVRAALSLLGIYIGVASLVVILSLREGIRRQIQDVYRTEGARVVFVHPGFDQVSKKIGRITANDIPRLSAMPGVLSVSSRSSGDMDVHTAAATVRAKVSSVDDRFIPIYRIPLIRGRNFFADEIVKKQPVCIITGQLARTLFPLSEPVGAVIDVQGIPFQVIGVVLWTPEATTRTSIYEVDMFVPPDWLPARENDFLSAVEVRLNPSVSDERALALVRQTISRGDAQREKLYLIRSLEQMVERNKGMNDRIMGNLLGIAAISLLVGGIGVANVMITSITERTREVGLRKALGARRMDILTQFLTESCVLAGSGGFLAVATAAIGIQILPSLWQTASPLVLPILPVSGCVFLTVLIGLLAGLYPASWAAALSPAEALRYE